MWLLDNWKLYQWLHCISIVLISEFTRPLLTSHLLLTEPELVTWPSQSYPGKGVHKGVNPGRGVHGKPPMEQSAINSKVSILFKLKKTTSCKFVKWPDIKSSIKSQRKIFQLLRNRTLYFKCFISDCSRSINHLPKHPAQRQRSKGSPVASDLRNSQWISRTEEWTI